MSQKDNNKKRKNKKQSNNPNKINENDLLEIKKKESFINSKIVTK